MKFILGKKMAMTQIWNEANEVVAVTPVKAGPCKIVQVKDEKKDGYNALQLSYGIRKEKNISKPQKGHFKGAGVSPQHVREFRTDKSLDFNIGEVISVNTFSTGDTVDVTGTSKGKGFQGVVKRHGFAGFRATHGNKDQERMPGSAGATGPAHVFKGTKMPGRMGNGRITVSNLEVISIDEEHGILFIKGALPGAINGLIMVKGKGDLQITKEEKKEEKKEEVKSEEKKEGEAKEEKVEEKKEEVKEEKVEEKKEEKKEEVKEEKKEEVKEAKKEEEKEDNKKEEKVEEKADKSA